MIENQAHKEIRARVKQMVPEYIYTSAAYLADPNNAVMLPVSMASAD